MLDGGAGVDTAVFSGRRSHYHVNLPGNGFIEITDLRPGSPDGIDQVIRVEQFIFSDGSFGAGQLLGGVTIIGTKGEDFINPITRLPGSRFDGFRRQDLRPRRRRYALRPRRQ